MTPCPACGNPETKKALYLGLPMRFCGCDNIVFGFWSFVPFYLPVVSHDDDGRPGFALFVYEGPYLAALWAWLRGD